MASVLVSPLRLLMASGPVVRRMTKSLDAPASDLALVITFLAVFAGNVIIQQ